MRKALPMSALITGLLALPGVGAASTAAAAGAALVAPLPSGFPAVMPAEIAIQMRRLARGEKLDGGEAHGMQSLHQRLTADIQDRLALVLADRERLYPVQLVSPVSALIPTRTEKAAFLGVATTPAPTILREQLNLPRGVGLVVDYLEKDSPAAAAGLQVHDVLAKLDDQWLINGQQLAVLVRDKKPGDAVTLTVIHAGKSQPVTVKLVEKELALLEDIPVPSVGGAVPMPGGIIRLENALPQMFPPNMAGSSFSISSDGSSIRRSVDDQNDITVTRTADGKEMLAVKDREGHMLYEGPGDGLDKAKLSDSLMKKIDALRKSPNEIRLHVGDLPATTGPTAKSFTANRKDDSHDITLKSDATGRHVTVKETPTGKTLFDGPVTTDDDLKTLPADVQEKIKAMQEKIK